MKFLTLFYFCTLFAFSLFGAPLKQVSLQLQWKYQFQFAGYIMAKEKGFYKDVGLDVALKEWEYPINSVDELISNRSEYAILRPTAMVDVAKGKELVFLAAIFQSSPLVLLADSSSNITSIKDFKDKKMMSTGDMYFDAALLAMMHSRGMKLEDMEIIPPSFDVRDLLNKKTDFIASYIANEPFVLRENGGTPVIFNPKDYGYDFYNDLVTVSKEYMSKNKEEVGRFKEATIKGWEYAFENINETVALIQSKYNSQNKSKEALLYEAKELKKLACAGTMEIGLIKKERLEKIYDVYKLLGLIHTNINLNTIIYNPLSLEVALTQDEKEYLKNKKTIKMCVDSNWMPFEKIDSDGKYIGMTAEYYKLFEKFLSTPFEIVPTASWSQSLQFAQKRACDILSDAMQTPERKKYLNFTTPFLSVPLVVATKFNHTFVYDMKDLKGKKVGVTKGYSFCELLKHKYSFLDLVEVANIQSGLSQVASGELDGYIDALASISYELQQEYGGELKIAGKFDENWELGAGVRNDDATLLIILQKAVNALQEEQRREILNKWVTVKYEYGTDYALVFKVTLGALVLLLLFGYWNYTITEAKKIIEKQNRELEVLATTDRLTGIYNRSKLDEILHHELERAQRYNQSFGCAIADIDHFKHTNDTYGHLAGDNVLVELSNLILNSMRESDFFGRWGGEEFLIIAPEIGEEGFEILLNKIRKIVAKHALAEVGTKTISIGATLYVQGDTKDTIVKRADDALYEAKNSGRDKVVIFSRSHALRGMHT